MNRGVYDIQPLGLTSVVPTAKVTYSCTLHLPNNSYLDVAGSSSLTPLDVHEVAPPRPWLWLTAPLQHQPLSNQRD